MAITGRINKNYFKKLLYCLKWGGFFDISKKITRNGIRILCYHNFTKDDDVLWLPGMNIRPETFVKRVNYLKRKKYHILTIDKAVELFKKK